MKIISEIINEIYAVKKAKMSNVLQMKKRSTCHLKNLNVPHNYFNEEIVKKNILIDSNK